jgi:hypothetical protein
MAVEFITNTRTSTYTGHKDDIIIVTKDGKFTVTSGHAIESGTSNVDYRVTVLMDGYIAAEVDGIYLYDTNSGTTGSGLHDVVIGAGGTIIAGDDGVTVIGNANNVLNAARSSRMTMRFIPMGQEVSTTPERSRRIVRAFIRPGVLLIL